MLQPLAVTARDSRTFSRTFLLFSALVGWSLAGCVTVGPPPQEVVVAPAPVAAPAPEPPADDPPARVGRLGYLEGQVSFRPASDEEWSAAVPNRPITSGDRLWSDVNSRAEVDAGAADFRFGSQTEVDVVRLDDDNLQLRLPQGTLIERVKVGNSDDNEIDAPNAAIVPAEPGEYRIDVTPDGATTSVTVLSGSAEVTSAGSSFKVGPQQVATIQGADTPTFNLSDAGPPDDFDHWSLARDAREDHAVEERRYVAADVPGAEDLDEYGRWSSDPQDGPVWYPNGVRAGWAPYHDGHWVWMSRWGWTWIDDAPWGWAPFHYGRWAYVNGAWGWCPGRTVVERPVYAPALVVFVGGGGPNDRRESGGEGSVGWVPLAPEEVYRPAYRTSATYVRQVNVTNVTNVTNITNVTNVTTVTNVTYRNREAPGGVTVVPEHALINAEPVRRASVVPAQSLITSRQYMTAPAVAPTRASLASHEAMDNANVSMRATRAPPATLSARPVMALHAPPPAPVSFAAEQQALNGNHGRPLAPTEVTALRQTSPPRPDMLPVKPAPIGRPITLNRVGTPTPAVVPRPVPTNELPTRTGANVPSQATPTPPTPVPTPMPRRELTRQPAGAPPPQPGATTTTPGSPLDNQYKAERAQMETRHRTEFASPPSGESAASLAERQDAEHRQLDQRYQAGRAQGAQSLPPKVEVRTPQAAPKNQNRQGNRGKKNENKNPQRAP